MSKKLLALLMTVCISATLISCGGEDKKKSEENTPKVSSLEEKYQKLEGTWAKDLTLADTEAKYNELLNKIEEKTKSFGLEYKKDEKVKDDDGSTTGEKFIYLDNEKPDKNRLESLYFGMITYGEKLESGQIQLKVSLNFDGEDALKTGKFNFGDTSLAAYSEIFLGKDKRDYSEINNKILEVLKSENGEGVFSDCIDGLYEEFTISKNSLIYRLETKKYDFKKAEEEKEKEIPTE